MLGVQERLAGEPKQQEARAAADMMGRLAALLPTSAP